MLQSMQGDQSDVLRIDDLVMFHLAHRALMAIETTNRMNSVARRAYCYPPWPINGSWGFNWRSGNDTVHLCKRLRANFKRPRAFVQKATSRF
jgi:hypothetical protein